jgi:hypothetical protein
VQSKNFHVEVKSMLGGEEVLLHIEHDGLTATLAGLTASRSGQTTTQASQTTTQAVRSPEHRGGSDSSIPEPRHGEEDWRKSITDYL